MNGLLGAWRRFSAYFASDDPHLGIAGTVCLVVVGNQPFYPAYLWWIAGGKAWVGVLTWISTPFFAAVPAVGRRHPLAGKLLLLAAGIGNTVLCAFAQGRATWVELFYLPCLALSWLMFDDRQRLLGLACGILPIILLGLAAGRSELAGFTPEETASLARLNAYSVAGLLIVMGVSVYRTRRG